MNCFLPWLIQPPNVSNNLEVFREIMEFCKADIWHLDSCQKLALTSHISLQQQKNLSNVHFRPKPGNFASMFSTLTKIGMESNCHDIPWHAGNKVLFGNKGVEEGNSWVFQLIFSINPWWCVTCQCGKWKMHNFTVNMKTLMSFHQWIVWQEKGVNVVNKQLHNIGNVQGEGNFHIS